ncbi:hypothetical protein RO21_10875 [[Actinobacillus] muris]|uniref:Uncharacterized protein n=1 Tax=Muribacter muris TaxID=67855 RepID=A0A0J5P4J7_9PAST|nr:hypothetical protein [Muribacter muris]KMK50615.1 hypothetical protein RO21_10875 [[Actinobacillus] muris] [Muribacter muris]
MNIVEKVMKTVWGISMVSVTVWLGYSLFLPAILSLPSLSDIGLFASVLIAGVVFTLFLLIWLFFGYATSVVASGAGFILGWIAEGVVTLFNYYKTRA